MHQVSAIPAKRAPRQLERLTLTSVRPLTLIVLALVVLVAAGCGGGGKSESEATTTETATTEAGTTTEAVTTSATESTATTTGASEDLYANKELATIPVRALQKCPGEGGTQWKVLYKGKHAIAQCGTGSAVVRAGSTTIRLKNGWCALYKRSGDVNYTFGAYVEDPTVSVFKQPEIANGPLRFGLLFGIKPHKPATHDGTYVDAPVASPAGSTKIHGITAVITGNGKNWANDQYEHSTTVTLTHGRTRGSFTATATTGEAMSGTFQCGDRIVSD